MVSQVSRRWRWGLRLAVFVLVWQWGDGCVTWVLTDGRVCWQCCYGGLCTVECY